MPLQLLDALLVRYLRFYNRRQMHLVPGSVRQPLPEPDRGYLLYLHIPFCEYLCPFCSFHRVKYRHEWSNAYFAALRREIAHYHELGFRFTEIYVGGGTPTVNTEQLTATLEYLRTLSDISRISVETNPNHLTGVITAGLLAAGVDRLSVGVQSLDDGLLQQMGRYQAYGSAAAIIARLREVQGRFATLNVDMIFNLPRQSTDPLLRDIEILKGIGVDQISWYPLMPAAVDGRQRMQEMMGTPAPARERDLYYTLLERLAPDYRPASAWCFVNQPGTMDEYIIDHDEYLGIGSGAFSYLNGTLYANTFSIKHYLELTNRGCASMTAAQALTLRQRIRYDFLIKLFGLTLRKSYLSEKYGPGWHRLLRKELFLCRHLHAVEESDEAYHLTANGLYWWILMMKEFFIGVNRYRDQMRALGPERIE